jgi:hypothetical protein
LEKKYLVGVLNSSNISQNVFTLDERNPPHLLAITDLTCIPKIVYMRNNIINEFEIGMIVDHEKFRIGKRKKHESTSQSRIIFSNDEHILKVEVDYDDRSILGVRISTNEQIIALGPNHESEFFTEYSVSDNCTAIIGFHMVYSQDRIVEISLLEAPLKKKTQNEPRPSSQFFERFNTHFGQKSSQKPKGEKDEVKSTFKLYKRLKKNQSF